MTPKMLFRFSLEPQNYRTLCDLCDTNVEHYSNRTFLSDIYHYYSRISSVVLSLYFKTYRTFNLGAATTYINLITAMEKSITRLTTRYLSKYIYFIYELRTNSSTNCLLKLIENSNSLSLKLTTKLLNNNIV